MKQSKTKQKQHRKISQQKNSPVDLMLVSILFLGIFILIFGMFFIDEGYKFNVKMITSSLLFDITDDNQITKNEIDYLRDLTCQDLKELLGTEKEVCIFIKDLNGNVVDFSNDEKFGFGCPGLEINGTKICNNKK
jgi:hypothetical protein